MATAVKQLDRECSKKIRFGQVINKVSDVVRELVDNAVDAGARSIQVLLVSDERIIGMKIEVLFL